MNDTIKKVKVEQMQSPHSNKSIANQFLIRTPQGVYFQSYESIIAFIPFEDGAQTLLDAHFWDYSTTTGKYRNAFLNEDINETRKKIRSGVYKLADLN